MFKHTWVLRYFYLIIISFSTCTLSAQTNDIEIPNVFTPNGDNVNDLFIVYGLSDQWTLSIYDRWGTLVYATEKVSETGWDGHNILGFEVVTGVYFYILERKDANQSHKGTIHLLR